MIARELLVGVDPRPRAQVVEGRNATTWQVIEALRATIFSVSSRMGNCPIPSTHLFTVRSDSEFAKGPMHLERGLQVEIDVMRRLGLEELKNFGMDETWEKRSRHKPTLTNNADGTKSEPFNFPSKYVRDLTFKRSRQYDSEGNCFEESWDVTDLTPNPKPLRG